MPHAFIVDAIRTPVGRRKGSLAGVHPVELGAIPLAALVERNRLDASAIEDVIYGCVTPVGEQGMNVGRLCALEAGFPVDTTGVQINRMCGSGQQAVHFAAMGVASGFQDLVIAGGVEAMTRVPMGSDMFLNGEMAAPSRELSWRFSIIGQGHSAELVAQKYGLSREELDAFSLESHRRAGAAIDAGKVERELVPVVHDDGELLVDEGIRRDTTLEKLAGLKPAFLEDGVITAGSSSQISDGSAALLIASEAAIKRYDLTPRARIVSAVTAGVDPTIMLTGPVPASRRALAKAGMTIDQIDAVEINEAFASVALGCGRDLGLDFAKTNVYGGAIANGHPLGASGAKLMTTLLNVLETEGGRYGLQTMCIGFGQATATIIDTEV
ncbi:MAG: thiolase family protein [Deltaproteobacteria bacterium]|nr:MAG: thiolase family protein [Deltaproteobacteria bacterium]